MGGPSDGQMSSGQSTREPPVAPSEASAKMGGIKVTTTTATVMNGVDKTSAAHPTHQEHPTSWRTWGAYVVLLTISKYTLPKDLQPESPTLWHVFYYGWVTALSTGLGAAPLLFAHDLGKQMLGVGNAVAAGMMLSASYSLVYEGVTVAEDEGMEALPAVWRVVGGILAGLVFILSTKRVSSRC
ncbi:unnamed protein product [Discosporangium mesarthrocarpum]